MRPRYFFVPLVEGAAKGLDLDILCWVIGVRLKLAVGASEAIICRAAGQLANEKHFVLIVAWLRAHGFEVKPEQLDNRSFVHVLKLSFGYY